MKEVVIQQQQTIFQNCTCAWLHFGRMDSFHCLLFNVQWAAIFRHDIWIFWYLIIADVARCMYWVKANRILNYLRSEQSREVIAWSSLCSKWHLQLYKISQSSNAVRDKLVWKQHYDAIPWMTVWWLKFIKWIINKKVQCSEGQASLKAALWCYPLNDSLMIEVYL